MRAQRLERADVHDAPFVEDGRPARERLGLARIMGHVERGRAALGEELAEEKGWSMER